jgi:hypothetical protein
MIALNEEQCEALSGGFLTMPTISTNIDLNLINQFATPVAIGILGGNAGNATGQFGGIFSGFFAKMP